MKFIHLADLHIGKKVNEFSMIEDQKYIFKEIAEIIENEKPDGVIIAGDVYDKSVPSGEAVQLFDSFLSTLSRLKTNVYVIYGNHDSDARIAFGGKLMEKSGVFMSPVYNGEVEPQTLTDKFGNVNIYMLPFIKPAHVRAAFPEEDIETYTDAMRVAISNMNIDKSQRNILITHQFVTGSQRTESEEISVGGTDNVDVSVYEDFDYVALGHIHRAQNCENDRVRYSGTPLKYSFSESKDQKSVTIVELEEKGTLKISTKDLHPLHDLKEIKGTYSEVMSRSFYENTTYRDDYMHITLTDEEDIPDAVGKLRSVYKNLMKLDYDNTRTRTSQEVEADLDAESKSPLELFSELYILQNNKEMSEEQKALMKDLIEKVWEEEK